MGALPGAVGTALSHFWIGGRGVNMISTVCVDDDHIDFSVVVCAALNVFIFRVEAVVEGLC